MRKAATSALRNHGERMARQLGVPFSKNLWRQIKKDYNALPRTVRNKITS